MQRVIFTLATIALVVGLATLAFGAEPPICADRRHVVERLGDRYGEILQEQRVSPDGQSVHEIYAHPRSGAWTLVVTTTEGRACVVAIGYGWRNRRGDPA